MLHDDWREGEQRKEVSTLLGITSLSVETHADI